MFESGQIGQLVVRCMKNRPDAICQIDAATGQEETNASVVRRVVRLARWLRQQGYGPGDVMAIGGQNHLDIHIPYYAALLNSMTVAGVDPLFKPAEIRSFFKLTEPKIAFCDSELNGTYMAAAEELSLATRVLTFSGDENSMRQLIENTGEGEEIEPAVVDQDKTYIWLVATGGTTGVLKVAAITYSSFMKRMQFFADSVSSRKTDNTDDQRKLYLNLSPIQWISGLFNALTMPLTRDTKLMSSAPASTDHVIDIINKYRPASALLGPSLATAIVRSPRHCDLTCLRALFVGGGKVCSDMYTSWKKRGNPNFLLTQAYGQTENLGPVLIPTPFGPVGNCGRPSPETKLKLVDPESGKEITDPNVPGELLTKGICFTEYYRNPEETAKVFTEDGWFKTGDILYRDENDYYYFVERIKMLIKYRSYHIVPPALEEVIRTHPGVLDVFVTSVPHEEDGEHPVACVVRRPGCDVTALQIKKLVADNFSETQHLRGGVIFMNEEDIPKTAVLKIARGKLRELALKLPRE